MNLKTTKVTIRGLTPLLMHNGQLSDPLNEHAKALAKLTSSKNKTDQYHHDLAETEWRGGLYVDENGAPCLPGEVLEAAIGEGGAKFKMKKALKGGLIIDGNFPLKYEGPKNVDKLWTHGGFMKRSSVKLNGKVRIIRTRPMFPEWECSFAIQWDPSIVQNETQLLDIVRQAGISGVGDYRPKFGRFEVVK